MLEEFSPKIFIEKESGASFGECEIDERLKFALSNRGISKLYAHQCEAIGKIGEGKNIVIVAPTASGKTESYMLPAVLAALRGENVLVVYPTKALSRDQLARWREFSLLGVRAEIFDGDTSDYWREKIKGSPPQVLITNFDMLHFLLMQSRNLAPFWKNLRLMAVDELHTYSGVLGAHVSNIAWRLKRVCEKQGNGKKLQFVCCSATIANAQEFANAIFEEEFEIVQASGAPKPYVEHYVVNPNDESYTTVALKIAKEIGRKTLVFCNSHAVAERLGVMAGDIGYPMLAYRAGLDMRERKDIEEKFKGGSLRALATTSALELGIDIGSVDAVVLAGFPGTITRFRQRVGRAGRKGQKAYAVYIARDNPLDQYFAESPSRYLDGEPERCFVNPYNEAVSQAHVICASRDFPLADSELSGKRRERASELLQKGMLKRWGSRLIPSKDALRFVKESGIRSEAEPIEIVDAHTGRRMGEREEHMAIRELHPGAIYLHAGVHYRGVDFDAKGKIAKIARDASAKGHYTNALHQKEYEALETIKEREVFGRTLYFGRMHIRDTVEGYVVKDVYTQETVAKHPLAQELVHEFDTMGLWLDFEQEAHVGNFSDGLHALEHVSISMMPAICGSDPAEIGGISYPSGAMAVYEGVAFGNGATAQIFEKYEKVMEMSADRLEKCACEKGCPKCIFSPMCGNNNRYLDKEAALKIAKEVLKN